MKNLIVSITFVLFISGCAYDMKEYHKKNKTDSWHTHLGTSLEVDSYYNSMPTYELCIEWDRVLRENYSSSQIDIRRKEIAQALQRRGENPLKCSNPNADNIILSEKKSKAALEKAKKAEREAEEALRKAREAKERCERTALKAYNSCISAGGDSLSCFLSKC